MLYPHTEHLSTRCRHACMDGGEEMIEREHPLRAATPDNALLPTLQVYRDERKVQKLMMKNKRSLGNPTPAHGCCSVGSATDGTMSGPPRIERTSVSLISADPLSGGLGSTGRLGSTGPLSSVFLRCRMPTHAALLLALACVANVAPYPQFLHANACCLLTLVPPTQDGCGKPFCQVPLTCVRALGCQSLLSLLLFTL